MAYDVRERMLEADGKLLVRRSQDVESLLKDNHELSTVAPNMHGEAAYRLAGRIPLVVAEQWSRECGEAIGTQGFAEYLKRKLADGDFAKLRVKGF